MNKKATIVQAIAVIICLPSSIHAMEPNQADEAQNCFSRFFINLAQVGHCDEKWLTKYSEAHYRLTDEQRQQEPLVQPVENPTDEYHVMHDRPVYSIPLPSDNEKNLLCSEDFVLFCSKDNPEDCNKRLLYHLKQKPAPRPSNPAPSLYQTLRRLHEAQNPNLWKLPVRFGFRR